MRIPKILILAGMACSAAVAQTFTVVNGASFTLDFPVAPGSYAQIFPPQGGSFSGVTGNTTAPSVPLPTTLADVQVLVNGTASPLWFVGSGVIAFVLPQATPTGQVPVRVLRAGTEIATRTITVIPSAPGIFFANTGGFPLGGVRTQRNDYTSSTVRAARGEVVVIAGTGMGPVNGTYTDAQGATGTANTSVNPVQVFISSERATVEYAGLLPGLPGLWQMNVRVPDRPFIAGQVPLFVSINGISSNAVTFWVAD
jgi:uncharacterized protein (TIGR03437 family)